MLKIQKFFSGKYEQTKCPKWQICLWFCRFIKWHCAKTELFTSYFFSFLFQAKHLTLFKIFFYIFYCFLKLVQAYSYAWYGNIITVEVSIQITPNIPII